MAFSTSNVRRDAFGSLKVTAGDWTGSAGDAAGTLGVEGGRVYCALFQPEGTTTPTQGFIPFSVSTSGAVTTLTVYNNQDVTTGRFLIIHA